ncbi:MAG: hypothetical protein U5K79_16785 [Cyclobacteriaceae bacterium]|nr:hypothetical protein [Cyclobacteriaceae bacterium]
MAENPVYCQHHFHPKRSLKILAAIFDSFEQSIDKVRAIIQE